MWLVWNGKRKENYNSSNYYGKCMSELWKKILTLILNIFNEIGDRSGCHQIPERSFTVNGYTFPICARCTGVGIGKVLAIIIIFIGIRTNIYLVIFLLVIMGLDWGIQYIGNKKSTNIRRLITGIFGGYGLLNIYFYIFNLFIN
jgi:uncharacterized membrane protein